MYHAALYVRATLQTDQVLDTWLDRYPVANAFVVTSHFVTECLYVGISSAHDRAFARCGCSGTACIATSTNVS